jgi:phosphoserine phosphatase RsbU/P
MPETLERLKLEQVGGPVLAEAVVALAGPVLLGRGTDCQIVLPDSAVSRRHALIEQRAGQYWLTDLESRAGTFINDVRLDAKLAAPLHEHDRIRIGAWRFRVRAAAARTGSMAGHTDYAGLNLGTSVPSSSGLTQFGAPMLAAQARLELLVEFVAACADKSTLEDTAATLMDFAKRASLAPRMSVWATACATPLTFYPDNFRPQALSEAFSACTRGGVIVVKLASVIPTRTGNGTAAVLAVRIDGEAIAFLQAEFDHKVADEALESLHALARLAGFSAGNIERRSAEKRIERLSDDLAQAHAVQQAILPPRAGLLCADRLRYALHVHPGRVVAGDMVDIFALSEELCAIVLGDVSGAGFGAAVQMASAQAYLHAELMETHDPAMAASRCNTFLARIKGGRFVTAWIAVLNARTGAMQVVDAGHGHARLVSAAGSVSPTLTGAIPLGIDPGALYVNEQLQLGGDMRVVLYSDGIAEHRGLDGSEFSTHLDSLLSRSPDPEHDVASLMQALALHGGRLPDDDATILSVGLTALSR